MTGLLLLTMICVAIAAQLFLAHQRQRSAARARSAVRFVAEAPSAGPAADQLFHRGHTWVQKHDAQLASVGVSALAANFAGELAGIELPQEGSRQQRDSRSLTLVAKNGRRLSLPMPIGGKVLAVNDALLREPALVQRRPYDHGWLLRMRPHSAGAELAPPALAQRWFDEARSALAGRFSPVPATVAFDGGEWVRAFGDHLDDEAWFALRDELFAARAPAASGSHSERGC